MADEDNDQIYAVIAENDESQWSDKTGEIYHFPQKYKSILKKGTKVIYYKGVLKKVAFREFRLTYNAHYFGIAEIGDVIKDNESNKGDRFAKCVNLTLKRNLVNMEKTLFTYIT